MFYEVYVGNLSISVSIEELKNLFSEVGKVSNVWINKSFKKITYGFVEFNNVYSAEQACIRFNDRILDFSKIKVRSLRRSKQKLELKVRRPNNSILLEILKKEGESKNHQVKKHLVKDLRQNKEIVDDFKKACLEAENIAFPQNCEIVYTAPEQTNLKTLETTITRYFKSTKRNTLQVDFDLSNGKRLTTEQNDKFFNMQLTKPRPVKPKSEKTEKPFALDYRAVYD